MSDNKGLRERLVLAALDVLREGDPVLIIGVGPDEVRFGWTHSPATRQVIEDWHGKAGDT